MKHTGHAFPVQSDKQPGAPRSSTLRLRNEHELRSESAGTGPFRHVVIYPGRHGVAPGPAAPAAPGAVISARPSAARRGSGTATGALPRADAANAGSHD